MDRIQIDTLVLMQMMKQQSSGNLLGVLNEDVLIVTNSYALPVIDSEEYIEKTINSLEELNYETQHVGWYQYRKPSSESLRQNIMNQYVMQKQDSLAVGIVIEKRFQSINVFGFKLTEYAMKSFDDLQSWNLDELIVKIPVTVENSYLLEAMCLNLKNELSNDFMRVSNRVASDSLEGLIEQAEVYGQELWKYNNRSDKKIKSQMPSRLDLLLVQKQIEQYCDHIEELAI